MLDFRFDAPLVGDALARHARRALALALTVGRHVPATWFSGFSRAIRLLRHD